MITLRINNTEQDVDVDPAMPLLWVLRDVLRLTGTKFGCGKGLCGACMVNVDGKAVNACLTKVSAVEGKSVTTIEGVTGLGKAVQQAWVAENVPQCGFCQPGQIMSAIALLAEHPDPSDTAIDQAMSRNICRCGTYQRIRSAIHAAVKLKYVE